MTKKSGKGKLIKRIIVCAVFVTIVGGVCAFVVLRSNIRDKNEDHEAMSLAADAHTDVVISVLPECVSLHDENVRLYNSNSRLSRETSWPSESADDYERRIKIQDTYKLNDYWLECAEKTADEAFECFAKGDWKRSYRKSKAVEQFRYKLSIINYALLNY